MPTKVSEKKKTQRTEETQSNQKICTCGGSNYHIVDGELRCERCGGISPKARFVDGAIVRIEPEVTCPSCGHRFTLPKK